jgi:hypothetical protein
MKAPAPLHLTQYSFLLRLSLEAAASPHLFEPFFDVRFEFFAHTVASSLLV